MDAQFAPQSCDCTLIVWARQHTFSVAEFSNFSGLHRAASSEPCFLRGVEVAQGVVAFDYSGTQFAPSGKTSVPKYYKSAQSGML